MKLLLLIPPSPFLINPMAFPSLGALYVASIAEEMGLEVKVADLSWQEFPDFEPDFIGISACTSHLYYMPDLMDKVKEFNKPIILGGPHFDVVPTDYLKLGADACSRGDGEETIRQFILGDRGILFGKNEDWPLPARHLIELEKYKYSINGLPATSMLTSRGCPFNCGYCSKTSLGKQMRFNKIEKVEEEVQTIKKLGFGGIVFYDDELNIITWRLAEICSIMKRENIPWRGFIRSDLFTEKQAQMMKDSNCYELCCGIESGSNTILNKIHKGSTVENGTRCRKICKDYGIRFKAFMIIGLPGETTETIVATERWLLEQRPEDFDLAIFTPYPGSPIADNPERYGVQKMESYWDVPYFHKGIPGSYNEYADCLGSGGLIGLRDKIEREVREELR